MDITHLARKVANAHISKVATGISEEGRRKYFEFPYHGELKDRLKYLGAKWDADTKRWWAAKNHKNIEKMEEAFLEIFGNPDPQNEAPNEAPQGAGKEYDFEFPYATEYHDPDRGFSRPLREVLKALGARWDAKNKVWYSTDTHPNFKRMTEVYDAAMGKQKKIDNIKQEKLDAEKAELDRLRNDVGYIFDARIKRFSQTIVSLLKKHDAIFDGKGWLLPDFDTRLKLQDDIRDIMNEEEAAKEIKQLGVDTRKLDRFTMWTKTKNPPREKGEVFIMPWDTGGGPGPHHKKGDAVVVKAIKSTWVRDDAMSFGGPAGWESGWAHTIFIAPATEAEAAPALEEEKKRLTISEAHRRVSQLEAEFQRKGQLPRNAKDRGQAYLPISKNTWIVGGGAYFFIGDKAIWYIRINGADGDTWANSNSASGIAYKMPKSPELEEEIKSLHEILHKNERLSIKTL